MKEQPEIKLFSALIRTSGPKGWSKHKFTIFETSNFCNLVSIVFSLWTKCVHLTTCYYVEVNMCHLFVFFFGSLQLPLVF